MIKQVFIITIRNLLKDKILSFINLTNLAIGFATFILISLFINENLSWDKHNAKYKHIYRLQLFMDQAENVIQHTWSVPAALSRHVLTNVPEIEKISLIHDVGDNNKNGVFLSVDKKQQFLLRYGYYADQTAFDIFTFTFLEGTSKDALVQPFSIVLSKTAAQKLFPAGNAIGKQVFGENKVVFTVTGIYDDLPENSTWRPTYILPMNIFAQLASWTDYENNYWRYSFYTYVLLKENASPASVDKKISGALKDYRKEHHPYLRPMSQFHLNPYYDNSYYIALTLLSFIALLILSLSSINFINLQTANATTRMLEIGIKKTVGFSKKALWAQFIFESLFISLLAGFMGLVLAELALPFFNRIIGMVIAPHVFSNWALVLVILAVTLLTGLVSGLYPSYIISSFNPVKALKQKYAPEEKSGLSLKKVLVTSQFSISIFLLVVSFIIYRQTHYMMTRDMGFDSHNIMFANIVTDKKGSFDQLRQKLLQHPEIADACMSDYIPFILPGGDDLNWEGAQQEDKVFVRRYNISYDFFTTFKIKIAEGRSFSRDYPNDVNLCLINETAARVFGWDKTIGKHINLYNRKVEVIGVAKDFIANTVHNLIEPHMYMLIIDSTNLNRIFTVRYMPGYFAKAKKIVDSEFEQYFPTDAFEFTHIQSRIQNNETAQAWTGLRNITIFFALLSILISSVGLFGLVMFFAKQKMKEIGIRKVLGFSIGRLYIKLSSEFIWLIVVAIVIAWPSAWFVYKYLPGAYKYPIQVWEFLFATGIILFVVVITISYHILKSARTNPVEILRYE